MSFFVFAWTVLFLAYVCFYPTKLSRAVTNLRIQIFVTPLWFPEAYLYWVHLVLEIKTVIFWLSTFALLADEASAWDIVDTFGFAELWPNGQSAVNATKAAAGLGALVWLSFVATLIVFSTCLFLHSCSSSGAKADFLIYRHPPPQTPPGTRRHWL